MQIIIHFFRRRRTNIHWPIIAHTQPYPTVEKTWPWNLGKKNMIIRKKNKREKLQVARIEPLCARCVRRLMLPLQYTIIMFGNWIAQILAYTNINFTQQRAVHMPDLQRHFEAYTHVCIRTFTRAWMMSLRTLTKKVRMILKTAHFGRFINTFQVYIPHWPALGGTIYSTIQNTHHNYELPGIIRENTEIPSPSSSSYTSNPQTNQWHFLCIRLLLWITAVVVTDDTNYVRGTMITPINKTNWNNQENIPSETQKIIRQEWMPLKISIPK